VSAVKTPWFGEPLGWRRDDHDGEWRTLQPSQTIRERRIKLKLNPLRDAIRDQIGARHPRRIPDYSKCLERGIE
jgi:hypothetical protein